MENEKLAALSVRPRVGHRNEAAFVTEAILIERRILHDLIGKFPAPRALAAAPVALRIAALNHEAFDDAVKRQPVVVTALGQEAKIFRGLRRIRDEQFEFDDALVGFEHGKRRPRRRRGWGGRGGTFLGFSATGGEEETCCQDEAGRKAILSVNERECAERGHARLLRTNGGESRRRTRTGRQSGSQDGIVNGGCDPKSRDGDANAKSSAKPKTPRVAAGSARSCPRVNL